VLVGSSVGTSVTFNVGLAVATTLDEAVDWLLAVLVGSSAVTVGSDITVGLLVASLSLNPCSTIAVGSACEVGLACSGVTPALQDVRENRI
jgi:hypothetical protein